MGDQLSCVRDLEQAGRKPQGSACLCFLSIRIKGMSHYPLFYFLVMCVYLWVCVHECNAWGGWKIPDLEVELEVLVNQPVWILGLNQVLEEQCTFNYWAISPLPRFMFACYSLDPSLFGGRVLLCSPFWPWTVLLSLDSWVIIFFIHLFTDLFIYFCSPRD